ncbi:MAG: hypothetical protein HY763_06115 [Planctomycetes bacterium]|nr:hypothetical protein [Planctomycetota bacterium]
MSLRTFHMVFLLVAMLACDLFGAWALHQYQTTRDALIWYAGLFSFGVGLAIAGYVIWVVSKLDRAHVE